MFCPQCGKEVSSSEVTCRHCGSLLRGLSPAGQQPPEPWDAHREGYLKTDFTPPGDLTVGGLLGASFSVIYANIAQIAKVILLVWLPLSAIKNYPGLPLLGAFLEAVITSLVAPALIYMLVISMRESRSASLGEIFRWGFRFWGVTFGNRILAGLVVMGGTLLLIIPGIIFIIWFLLVDAVVAVEGDQRSQVLRRSRDLTEGYRLVLFGLWLTWIMIVLPLVFLTMMLVASVNHWAMVTLVDVILALFSALPTAGILLAYLHLAKLKGGLPDEQEMSLGIGPATPPGADTTTNAV